MTRIICADFSRRLNEACDAAGEDFSGRARADELAARLTAGTGSRASAQAARKWLSGVSEPRRGKMADIARILGVSPAWLIDGSGDMRPGADPRPRMIPTPGGEDARLAGWGRPISGPEADDLAAGYIAASLTICGVRSSSFGRRVLMEPSPGATTSFVTACARHGEIAPFIARDGEMMVLVVPGPDRYGRFRTPPFAVIPAGSTYEGGPLSVSTDGGYVTVGGGAIHVGHDLSALLMQA